MNQHVLWGSFGSNRTTRTGTAPEGFVRSFPFRGRTEPRTGASEPSAGEALSPPTLDLPSPLVASPRRAS